ncbi:MAG: hypothetical protein CMP08_04950 [Xanthomonadales bacterium]|nr:hypothetical protein [Xanthomonadales bacterium]|tara:strand:+ start:524 stop:1318 length:795 start_codon:yes stop_codon:yes gene_type:complete
MTQGNTATRIALLTAVAGSAFSTSAFAGGDLTANATFTTNYIWRGLTQTLNDPAVQGGIDYVDDSGLYVGTWLSNVKYANATTTAGADEFVDGANFNGAGDRFSYENDLYFGYTMDTGPVSWDAGYLYYNYDSAADFDFGEVYLKAAAAGFSLAGYMLTNTEANEGPGQDFSAGSTYYLSGDYGIDVYRGIVLGAHVGYHAGDFSEAFNVVDGNYLEYNVSVSKAGFSLMASDTDVDGIAAGPGYQNDDVRYVLSYSIDIDLLD